VAVNASEALRTCQEILDCEHDDVPVQAFYFSGGIAEIRSKAGPTPPFGPVTRQIQDKTTALPLAPIGGDCGREADQAAKRG
jgi:hypothetical protein